MTTENPGYGERITELERRVTVIEEQGLPVDVAVMNERLNQLHNDLKALKHAVYAGCVLLVAVGGMVVPLLRG